MKSTVHKMFKNEVLLVFIFLVLLILTVNTISTFYYRSIIRNNSKTMALVLEANQRLENMNKNVNLVDLGFRGYMIHQSDQLLHPFNFGYDDHRPNFDRLEEVLDSLGYDVSKLKPAEEAIANYLELVKRMIQMISEGQDTEVQDIFVTDPGYEAWKVYSVFDTDARTFINEIERQADEEYRAVIIRMIATQSVLFVLGFPLLILVIWILRRNFLNRKKLFEQLHSSNQKYIFNTGKNDVENDEESIIQSLISNLKKVSTFIKQMAGGNYSVYWEGLGEGNHLLNQESIAGELVKMRDEIQKMKQQDDLSIWKTEGLAKFSDIIREQQDDLKVLYQRLLSEIVGYLEVQRGALFVMSEDENQGVQLKMQACYACERPESNEQIIEPGVGMVGQCFLDGEMIYMKEVPEEYVHIASGLGDTVPKSILLIPLKSNDVVEGVLELASLEVFRDHEIAFLMDLGEIIASTISRMKAVTKTSDLLQQSQQQAEEMRSQEEEMRQNMEELQATQEQMVRKNQEFEELLQKSAEREKKLLEELTSLRKGQQ